MTRTCIIARIDSALEKARWQGMKVRAICLSEVDCKAFNAAMCKRWKEANGYKRYKAVFLSYGDHLIRYTERSSVWSTEGVEVKIPKRLSPRVEALAA